MSETVDINITQNPLKSEDLSNHNTTSNTIFKRNSATSHIPQQTQDTQTLQNNQIKLPAKSQTKLMQRSELEINKDMLRTIVLHLLELLFLSIYTFQHIIIKWIVNNWIV